MLIQEERELIVEYGKKLITCGLTKGTGGNISICNRAQGLMAISPSGLDYFETLPEDVAVVSVEDGKIAEGKRKPSSELELHRIFYVNRGDIDAVVHTHSTFATTLATLGWGLPASNYLIALAGPDVRCAPYASFGTPELAQNAFEYMKDRYCVLLSNHGLVAGAKDIANAFNIASLIEECCETYYRAKVIGEPQILSEDEMAYMMERFKTYGQVKKKE
ncbi:MAG: L-fuculose-phosphate aldolase [Bacillota bacterium]